MKRSARSRALTSQNPPALLYALASPSDNGLYYVYILQSEKDDHHYVGLTTHLAERLKKHNWGQVPHTAKYRPWRYETVIRFSDKEKAAAYEKYLKSHSGREYAKRHF